MKLKFSNLLVSSLLSLIFFVWGAPVHAVDPDLIDVLEITDTNNPIIVHENILPGDSFTDIMTVKNVSSGDNEGTFDIGMNLDIDTSKGFWNFPNFKLEQEIMIKIQRDDSTFVTLPNGFTESTLHDLDGTTIALGSIAPGVTEVFTVLAYFNVDAGNEYQNTKVYFNLDIGVEILGESPRLLLRKSNDSVSDETPGNEVVYTLEITAEDGSVDDVTVTDLPPEGFAYVAGSGEGAPFIHEYASPGIWDLGDMAAGETKTLTYKTKISGAQDAGLYKDLAFAKGVAGESAIFANSEADPFVGTQVNVVLDTTPTVVLEEDNENKIVEKTKKRTQYVLGAATTLPMTGTPLGMIELALAGLVAGLGLIFVARRRATVLPTLVLLLVGGFALMPEQAAAANLSVKIETPEAVTDTPNIKIGFVTLDVLGRDLTVECYEGAAVTPFATYALASAFGGNSGDCQVNGTVMPTDGNYEFYVKAIASGEGNETVESNHVSVTLASATPGTPYNYDRSDASCQNVITFTTADDGGKTVKVELYRSTETTFVANAGTKVDEVAIGSNANGSFVEAAPGCSNDAFYALRAVAANGNGSDFVGDKDVNVDTHTVTKNKTTTVTLAGGSTSGTGAIPVSGGSGVSEGQVEGATTTNEETETPTSLEQNEPGSVLGEMTEASTEAAGSFWDAIKNHPWRSFFWLVIVVALGYFGYQSYRGKHDQSVQ